jgi:hypothetical protein
MQLQACKLFFPFKKCPFSSYLSLYTTHIKKSIPHDAHPKKSVGLNPPAFPRHLSSPLPNWYMSFRSARISVWEMVQKAKETTQFNPTAQMLREVNLFGKMSKVQSNSRKHNGFKIWSMPTHNIWSNTHTYTFSFSLCVCVRERERVCVCVCVCSFLLIGLSFSLILLHLCSHRVYSGKSRSYLANPLDPWKIKILLGNPIQRSLPKRKRYLTIRWIRRWWRYVWPFVDHLLPLQILRGSWSIQIFNGQQLDVLTNQDTGRVLATRRPGDHRCEMEISLAHWLCQSWCIVHLREWYFVFSCQWERAMVGWCLEPFASQLDTDMPSGMLDFERVHAVWCDWH